MCQTFRAGPEGTGRRLDSYLSEQVPELSRGRIQKLIEEGRATVNGKQARASLKLKEADQISLSIPPLEATPLSPEHIPLRIVYEDDNLLVIDKPAGLTVHPAPGHLSHTLVNALLAYCPGFGEGMDSQRPGIVHRLDKNTSGLMVVAKNEAARQALMAQLKERTMDKRYLALVQGHVTPKQGLIEAPIDRDPRDRKKMAVVSTGREALTRYRVLEYVGDCTLIEAKLETGRTHQIRVHFAAIGHPVVGDAVYGKKSRLVHRQFLHSWKLGLRHPRTGEWLEFTSELPEDLREALERVNARR